ncbi:hypothetical protein IEQ34_001823 [Dendrobium chrysotoxum]|uniref:Uncharacterized protein n=1 Tax=Dendrobium chrysotoxum TaxID=161865 RepID=A0AAV7H7V8_DENCH|nr:hypothetical protein IEQ34_001823 [Dendrobium chrysotoxum]
MDCASSYYYLWGLPALWFSEEEVKHLAKTGEFSITLLDQLHVLIKLCNDLNYGRKDHECIKKDHFTLDSNDMALLDEYDILNKKFLFKKDFDLLGVRARVFKSNTKVLKINCNSI